ncbi:FAD/NAD(P)-binding protein [Rubrivivax rivuli]|uniref:FAD-dependent urate hydroxylase HpyO/Asp monooxygenase CreE-like FAD/NAD(P)-binding domain-containing protein n=1 Tax=Rubrivivax rivuli TaxID=1862385 RepID=A0A437RAJ1_9BURK|nr:FAD/NAD(P)-binding protein [Rubrivivax rivuli]RVU43820.1 hypothetical protein EOE66_19325 [Rubrivivax rivuli]
MPTTPTTVLIVGAGFSGTATAVQLLRGARAPLQVLLLNESGRMARGLAYGTDSLDHVLNVPAGNMSALADDPENFLRYGRWVDARWHAGSFVPRRLYGAYLESLLAAAESTAGPQGARLQRLVGRALRVLPPGLAADATRARVLLEDGRELPADHVVLAFGHVAPEHPLTEAQRAVLGTAYTADPWRQAISERVQPADRVLLVGAGLTALDMLVSLDRAGHRGPVHMLSRRGLAPQPHRDQDTARGRPAGPDAQAVHALLQGMGTNLRSQLRALREAVATAVAAGGDWRDWIAALRPHTRAWWQALDEAERRRFLRHLQPHWDTLRHRCAPAAHAVFERWRREGRLTVEAGRIHGLQAAPTGGYTLALRPRGSTALRERSIDHVVNCTSPSGRLTRSPSALVAALLAEGLVQPDALELGLQVHDDGRVIGRNGTAADWLHYVGPLLKARDWEATAIPELRQHAAALAQRLLQQTQV